jgi:hypothetical protein
MMESILYSLIKQTSIGQQEVNYWMDYLANAANFIVEGFWIDAKIMLNRALHVSRASSIESLKSDTKLKDKLDVLQRATSSYFEEIKGYPLRLQIPDDRLDTILSLQGIMFDLRNDVHERKQKEGEFTRAIAQIILGLSSAIRYLMKEDKISEAKDKLIGISSIYKGLLKRIEDTDNYNQMKVYDEMIEKIREALICT